MNMTPEHKSLWIKLRAEIIKHFQDTRNPNLFVGGFSIEKATERAKNQLEFDLIYGELRITLEEMLLNTPEECVDIEINRNMEFIQKHISQVKNNGR